jgi:hypothetical protein
MRRAAPLLIALSAPAFLSTGSSPAATPDSGIRAYVTISGCPGPERVDGNCTEPYAAYIVVRRRSDYKLIRKVHAAANGRFRLRLRPDRYLLEPQPRTGLPFAVPVVVKVRAHRFTSVHIDYDRGLLAPTPNPGMPEPPPGGDGQRAR